MMERESGLTYRGVRPEGPGQALEVLAAWVQRQSGPVVVNVGEYDALLARGLSVEKLPVGGPQRGEAWVAI